MIGIGGADVCVCVCRQVCVHVCEHVCVCAYVCTCTYSCIEYYGLCACVVHTYIEQK